VRPQRFTRPKRERPQEVPGRNVQETRLGGVRRFAVENRSPKVQPGRVLNDQTAPWNRTRPPPVGLANVPWQPVISMKILVAGRCNA
jgi:hypothetical protein